MSDAVVTERVSVNYSNARLHCAHISFTLNWRVRTLLHRYLCLPRDNVATNSSRWHTCQLRRFHTTC